MRLPGLPPRDPQRTAEVKARAAEFLPVPPGASLLVTELTCTEPGCPPTETAIAVLVAGAPPVQWKLHKPLAAVTRDDLAALAAGAARPADSSSPHAG